jgi:hypothetical protein
MQEHVDQTFAKEIRVGVTYMPIQDKMFSQEDAVAQAFTAWSWQS